MYHAKESGRNNCRFFRPDMNVRALERQSLEDGLRRAMERQELALHYQRVAVNISAVELRDNGFVAAVRSILMETGVDPTCVELELTETFLLQDSKSTTAVLHALKDLGVGLALDDFGTGYSSLSHLKRFPIDALKIDQSFVRDIATDADDASIVRAVISMGKSLQMRVVAEGVETREQLAFLQQQRCPEGQGYYFSRPIAPVEFAQLLGRSVGARIP